MASELALQKAAQAWCTPATSNRVMDADLAEAFADILDEVWNQSWLGNATTRELIAEISTRVDLDYKTTGDTILPTRESDEEIAARVVHAHLEAHGSTADIFATDTRSFFEQMCLEAITEAARRNANLTHTINP